MQKICYLLIFISGCTIERDKYTPAYAPFSRSVIHLKFNDDPADSLSVGATVPTNIPKGGSVSNRVMVGNSGDYYLNIETDRPSKSLLSMGDKSFSVFLMPKDTTHIYVSIPHNEFELGFYGQTKEINEYYHEKKNHLGYMDTRFPLNEGLSSKSTYKRIKQKTDSIINQELLFFEGYASSHKLPEWFVDYEESEIIYMGVGYKTAMPHGNEIQKYFKDTLPRDYFDYLRKVKIDNPKAILSSQYFAFLDEYFMKDLPVAETKDLTGFARTTKIRSHILGESENQLSGDISNLYNKSNFSLMLNFYADSAAMDSLARKFQVSDYKVLVRVAGTRSRNEMQMMNMNRGDTIPDFILTNILDSLISIRTFQDQVLYLNFWATWCGPCINNIPELNKTIELYNKNANVKFLNICLDSEHDKWLASVKKHKLKGVNLYAAGNWNSRLRSYFNIKGIPHYVIIGEANILVENATDKAPSVEKKLETILARR